MQYVGELALLQSENDLKEFLQENTPEDITFHYLFASKRRNGTIAGFVFHDKKTALPSRPLLHVYKREDVIRFLLTQIKNDEVYLARPNDFKNSIVISFEIKKKKDIQI